MQFFAVPVRHKDVKPPLMNLEFVRSSPHTEFSWYEVSQSRYHQMSVGTSPLSGVNNDFVKHL